MTNKIVAAAKPLQPGEAIKAESLTLIDWPSRVPLQGTSAKIEDLVGRFVLYPVAAQQPIVQSSLAPAGSGFGLTAKIPDGMNLKPAAAQFASAGHSGSTPRCYRREKKRHGSKIEIWNRACHPIKQSNPKHTGDVGCAALRPEPAHFVFPSEKYGAAGQADRFGFIGGSVRKPQQRGSEGPTSPSVDWPKFADDWRSGITSRFDSRLRTAGFVRVILSFGVPGQVAQIRDSALAHCLRPSCPVPNVLAGIDYSGAAINLAV